MIRVFSRLSRKIMLVRISIETFLSVMVIKKCIALHVCLAKNCKPRKLTW